VRRALALELLEKRPPLPRRARVSHLVQ
jgi:hypothetical protein